MVNTSPVRYIKPLSIIPANDQQRLNRLASYEILDSVAEETFDKIARLAAKIFNAPNAFISFVDKDRVFFKSNISSIPGTEVLRKDSLCSLAILEDHVTVFTDTHESPDLLESPHVSRAGGIRFYAGAPLITPEGFKLGTICVTDSDPRLVTKRQVEMLETLATIVIDELELRLTNRKTLRMQSDLVNMAVHDLKNPMSSILLYAKLLADEATEKEDVQGVANRMVISSQYVLNSLNDLLNLSQLESGALELNIEFVDLNDILNRLKINFDILAKQKNQLIVIQSSITKLAKIDKIRIQEVVENLLSNAIKYAHHDTEIIVKGYETEDNIIIEFIDQGQGLLDSDIPKLFKKFCKLSAVPTGNERSNGLGLCIVEMLVKLHNGSVWATSAGKDKGSTFSISLPYTHS